MGATAKDFVRETFLLTRHLRDYLAVMFALTHQTGEWIHVRDSYGIVSEQEPGEAAT
jgi:trehalose synthase